MKKNILLTTLIILSIGTTSYVFADSPMNTKYGGNSMTLINKTSDPIILLPEIWSFMFDGSLKRTQGTISIITSSESPKKSGHLSGNLVRIGVNSSHAKISSLNWVTHSHSVSFTFKDSKDKYSQTYDIERKHGISTSPVQLKITAQWINPEKGYEITVEEVKPRDL